MILIVTHKEDYTVDFVVEKLNQREIKYKRLNTEDIFTKNNVVIKYSEKNFDFLIDNISQFQSIWFRRIKLPKFNDVDNSTSNYLREETYSYFLNMWQLFNTKWLSNPDAIYRAENKLLQLKIAQKIGFNIPKTLIAYNMQEIIDFYLYNNKDIIIKPLYNSRFQTSEEENRLIYTNKLTDNQISNINSYMSFPSIIQENIKKRIEIRTTVVNNNVFSAFVDSQKNANTTIDWRREKCTFNKIDIPESIKNKCIELTKELNLGFGAIDLILTEQGEYKFLEINPNGQWAWIEVDTGLPIADAIIDYLTIN